MKLVFALTLLFLGAAVTASAQVSWLDAKVIKPWNTPGQALPAARSEFSEVNDNCKGSIRPATLPVDKLLTAKGWYLVGSAQVFGGLTAVEAAGGFDGMCRPEDFNVFVFSGDKLLGTLSPKLMQAREDGSLGDFQLFSDSMSVTYNRYRKTDPLCCPSRTSSMYLTLEGGMLKPGDVTTTKNPTQ